MKMRFYIAFSIVVITTFSALVLAADTIRNSDNTYVLESVLGILASVLGWVGAFLIPRLEKAISNLAKQVSANTVVILGLKSMLSMHTLDVYGINQSVGDTHDERVAALRREHEKILTELKRIREIVTNL